MGDKKYKKRQGDWLLNFKEETGCQICGYKEHPEILVVHHKKLIRRKNSSKRSGSFLSYNNPSIATMKKELKKCLILCPTCHAWLHYQDNQFKF